MLIGYAKLGRVISLSQDGWGFVGGDNEPPRTLHTLATRRPEDTFVILSLCDDDPQECGFPPNVVNAWTPERREWLKEQMKPLSEAKKNAEGMEELSYIVGIANLMDQLLQPYAEQLDGMIIWAGQHGTANSVLPAVTQRSGVDGWTRPYDSFAVYAGGLLRLINTWRDFDPLKNEEIWLIADARNYVKARDLKWPMRHPILGQYDLERNSHHERYGDVRDPGGSSFEVDAQAKWKTDHTWNATSRYVYSRLEICGILPEHSPIESEGEFAQRDLAAEFYHRRHFGLFVNEAGAVGRNKRREIIPEWVYPLVPAFLHGKWPQGHAKYMGTTIEPAPWEDYYPLLKSVLSTFTTPSSGSGWATTKPWEAFGAGTVCFKHPAYDDQMHIYGEFPEDVQAWLCPQTPEDLAVRVKALNADPVTWEYIVRAQRELFDRACSELRHAQLIEDRLERKNV